MKMCDECNGTGIVGEYVDFFGAYIDFECQKCNGEGFIDEEVRNDKQSKGYYGDT